MLELLPASSVERVAGRWPVEVISGGTLARVTTRIPQASELEAAALAASVREAYISIGTLLSGIERYPIRFWNFVPGIGHRLGELDRYMVFNEGRFEALTSSRRLSGHSWSLSTSSAVGITGEDLVIECLASDIPGTAVENPRQISSWRYSARYGPKPPCFARATIATIDAQRWLLIGGTASIVGEDSLHRLDVEAQLAETFANLETLITIASSDRSLRHLTDVRTYVARAEDAGSVESAIRSLLADTAKIEVVAASICRPELLVEIEGRVLLEDDRSAV